MTQTTDPPQPLRLTNAFEPAVIALIRDMEADGWTGRISNRGHAIMRSPDGLTTASVSPKVGAPHRAANLGSEYRRWKRGQAPKPKTVKAKPKGPSVTQLKRELDQAYAEILQLRGEVACWQTLAEEAEEAYLNCLAGTPRR